VIICGIIVAGLGVLNDVTVTQASAVWELAESSGSRRELYRRAMRIGRDHIASSVYTIAFATAGAALSTLLLLSIYAMPLGDMLRSEAFSEEIIRTLVGSIGLVLAVPLTTALGAVLAWQTMHGGDDAGRPPRARGSRGSRGVQSGLGVNDDRGAAADRGGRIAALPLALPRPASRDGRRSCRGPGRAVPASRP
jgi:hypothetical protein